MTEALIALGANLGNRAETLTRALELIRHRLGPITRESHWYVTRALLPELVLDGRDPPASPDYLNLVVACETGATPENIMDELLASERELGRVRGERWAARLIDLDLLGVGDEVRSSAHLTLPHPEIQNRDFVLLPMMDVAPHWTHPVLKLTTEQMLASFRQRGLEEFVRGVFGQ